MEYRLIRLGVKMKFFKRLLGIFSLGNKNKEKEEDPIGIGAISEAPEEMIRARDDKGRYIADDPKTEDVNEAYVPRKVKTS
jgi:hypothetical protein